MHRLTAAHASSADVNDADQGHNLRYQPEPLVLARVRDACCDPWPAFQPAVRRLMCSTLDAMTDVFVQYGHEQQPAGTVSGPPDDRDDGDAIEPDE